MPLHIMKSPLPDLTIPDLSIPEFIFGQCTKFANQVVFLENVTKKKMTYAQLIHWSTTTAANLQALGLKKGEVVAIFSSNTPDYYLAIFGVALAGGVSTLLNPSYTDREVAFQLKDSNAKYLICGNAAAHTTWLEAVKLQPDLKARIKLELSFDKVAGVKHFATLYDHTCSAKAIAFRPVKINSSTDEFILPYSSGTTGLPKGVCLTHRNVLSNILQITEANTEKIDDKDVFVAILPLYHIYGLVLNMTAMIFGVKIVMMPKFDLVEYLTAIQTYRATFCHVVPPICVALAKHPIVTKFDLSSLRKITSGAAPLSEDTEQQIFERLKLSVVQGYGMTELSPASHYAPKPTKQGSVGKLLPNTEAVIVDANGNSVSVGQDGELWIRGPQVMKGYLNRPKETASTIDSAGFLHTGDVARVDGDGFFYIVDRVKELIKYKGSQVAPAELEGLLLSHASIADCAVIGVPDESAGELPLAFVVCKENKKLTEDEVKQFVAKTVAPTKLLRGGVRFVDVIPKSPSGKILRRVLRDRIVEEAKLKSKL